MVWGISVADDGYMGPLSSCGSMASKDGVVQGLNVEDTKLCDNVERVRANWQLDCARGTCFAPVKTVEERLCPELITFGPAQEYSPLDLERSHKGC